MRLLLDANLSGRRIGRALREEGHDVFALGEHPELDGLTDHEVLALAVKQARIVITRNSKDFAPLLREWASESRDHAGCILIWTLGHHQFGPILRGIRGALEDRPRQREWVNVAVAI